MLAKQNKPKSLAIIMLLAMVQQVLAQSEESPPSETEIICYAAQKQWVCAPADQKQKAHEKAMQLALDNPDDDNDEPTQSLPREAAEIQAMDLNPDFAAQVQEEPVTVDPQAAALSAAIKDFTANDQAEAKVESTDDSEVAEVEATPTESPNSNQAVDSNNKPAEVIVDTSLTATEVPLFKTAPNDFDHWQLSFADQWTFQVVGTSNRHHLGQFITQHGLHETNYTLAKTQVNGADWWVVLTGLYATREQALSQRANLPAALAANAWVRQVSSIVGEADR